MRPGDEVSIFLPDGNDSRFLECDIPNSELQFCEEISMYVCMGCKCLRCTLAGDKNRARIPLGSKGNW